MQTLNAGTEGDAIFGGKGDDIINLGGGKDFVFYRYDGDGYMMMIQKRVMAPM